MYGQPFHRQQTAAFEQAQHLLSRGAAASIPVAQVVALPRTLLHGVWFGCSRMHGHNADLAGGGGDFLVVWNELRRDQRADDGIHQPLL